MLHPSVLSLFRGQNLLDHIANSVYFLDPFGFKPQIFSRFGAARELGDFVLGNIFAQRIVLAEGLGVGVEPCALAFSGEQPVDRYFGSVGMGARLKKLSVPLYAVNEAPSFM
jgi:hypothetical protein